MKLSSQSIALCTVLFAAIALDAADASGRKLLRNKRLGADRKRNLFEVESALKDVVEVDDADLARALMGDMSMSMSMSMPSMSMPSMSMPSMFMSMPSDGGSSSGNGSSNGGSSSGGNGSSNGGSSSGGSTGSEGSTGSDGSTGSGGSSSGESESPNDPNGTTIGMEKQESGEAAPSEGSDADNVVSTDKSAPEQKTDDENDDSAAPSRRNIAVVAITTTAMAVPLLF